MILQLARTAPMLTGQCKLDIMLEKSDGRTVTGDFCFSAITDRISATDTIDSSKSSLTLAERLRRHYSCIEDSFWSESPRFSSLNPIYSDQWKDTYDHTYLCGCDRLRYSKYSKQFSLLCPMWIDDESAFDRIEFEITISAPDGRESVKTRFKISDTLREKLGEYLAGIDSKLIDINIDARTAYASGFDVSSGCPVVREVSSVIDKILKREVTVMELDSILDQTLSSNKIVARQLLNLCFVFNIRDIMPDYCAGDLDFKTWKIQLDAYDLGVRVPKKDIWCNYDRIPAYVLDVTGGHFSDQINALDYLCDYSNIETIFTGKMNCTNHHWCIEGSPRHPWNLYSGFSPLYEDGGSMKVSSGLFFNMPDPYADKYSMMRNNLNWCKIIDRTGAETYDDLVAVNDLDEMFTHMQGSPGSVSWIDGLKYSIPTDGHSWDFWVNIVLCRNYIQLPGGQEYRVAVYKHNMSETAYSIVIPMYYQGSSNDAGKDACTLNGVLTEKMSAATGYGFVEAQTIQEFMKCFEHPKTVVFTRGLSPVKADSPDVRTSEIEYETQDMSYYSSMYRYFGNLIPMFTDLDDRRYKNMQWRYDTWGQTHDQEQWKRWQSKGYLPVFPSIGYFPMTGEDVSYDAPLDVKSNLIEYKWFWDSTAYVLPEKIMVSFMSHRDFKMTDAYVRGVLWQRLEADPLEFDQWIDRYRISVDWEYESIDYVQMIRYDITFELK